MGTIRKVISQSKVRWNDQNVFQLKKTEMGFHLPKTLGVWLILVANKVGRRSLKVQSGKSI